MSDDYWHESKYWAKEVLKIILIEKPEKSCIVWNSSHLGSNKNENLIEY